MYILYDNCRVTIDEYVILLMSMNRVIIGKYVILYT